MSYLYEGKKCETNFDLPVVQKFPFISVIIIAHDRREYLITSIQSALNQTLSKEAYEVIVVKNFSDPAIDSYIGRNGILSILTNETAIGSKISLALSKSSGRIISFLEDDDAFEENKLEVIYSKFSEDPGLMYLHNSFITVDTKGSMISRIPVFMRVSKGVDRTLDLKADSFGCMNKVYKFGIHFNLSSISIRKDAIDSSLLVGRYNLDIMFFYLIGSSFGIVGYTSLILTRYRVHQSASKVITDDTKFFLESKIEFYRLLLGSLSYIYDIIKGKLISDYCYCDMTEQELILGILGSSNGRKDLLIKIQRTFRCLSLYKGRKFVYNIVLALLGVISLISSKVPVIMLYIISKTT
jgi:glycosyltransferase involved in cell wall biosynthesis